MSDDAAALAELVAASPINKVRVLAWRDRGKPTACEYRPGTCADMTIC